MLPIKRGRPPKTQEEKNDPSPEELNAAFSVKPKVGSVYGRKFGSRKVTKLYAEAGVAMVAYLDGQGQVGQESVLMFNRWAHRRGIPVP